MSKENAFGFIELTNEDLSEENLPAPNADFWGVISRFALSYDGYAHYNSPGECGRLANMAAQEYHASGQLPVSLDELRACLFFEQRRWNHLGTDLSDETLKYIHALVEAIRSKVSNRRS